MDNKTTLVGRVDTVIEDMVLLRDGKWVPDEDSINATIENLEQIKTLLENQGSIWVVAFGSPFSGMTLSGPFYSPEDAAEHAESVDVPWEVIEIEPVNAKGG
jgi:hypothetical protein